MLVGFAGLLAWFWTPHSRIETAFGGTHVELTAPKGLGYEYRWDANSDGEFETGWISAPETSFEYGPEDVRGVAVFLGNVQSGIERRIRVTEDWTPIPVEHVIPPEQLSPKDRGFEVRLDGQDLLFRKPYARTRATGSLEKRLRMGEKGRLGPASVFARPLVEATLVVRNAFGNARLSTKEIVLPFAPEAPSHASLRKPLEEVVQ
jgi:hypothetical protein